MNDPMQLEAIDPADFVIPAFARWTERNFLLTASWYWTYPLRLSA